jgi:hypothetical protein
VTDNPQNRSAPASSQPGEIEKLGDRLDLAECQVVERQFNPARFDAFLAAARLYYEAVREAARAKPKPDMAFPDRWSISTSRAVMQRIRKLADEWKHCKLVTCKLADEFGGQRERIDAAVECERLYNLTEEWIWRFKVEAHDFIEQIKEAAAKHEQKAARKQLRSLGLAWR